VNEDIMDMKDSCCKSRTSVDDITQMITDAVEMELDLAGKVMGFIADGAGKLMREVVGRKAMFKTGSCCDIPAPCWMPSEIGEVVCHLCHCGQGIVRLRIVNTAMQPRTFNLVATGAAAAQVSFDVASFTLGAKERKVVTATFKVPDKTNGGPEEFEALIWVLGCNNHYLRWVVEVGKRERPCCHEFEVADGPDYLHHWYDHFYCRRGCFGYPIKPGPSN
jgi:hypothetical protein